MKIINQLKKKKKMKMILIQKIKDIIEVIINQI